MINAIRRMLGAGLRWDQADDPIAAAAPAAESPADTFLVRAYPTDSQDPPDLEERATLAEAVNRAWFLAGDRRYMATEVWTEDHYVCARFAATWLLEDRS